MKTYVVEFIEYEIVLRIYTRNLFGFLDHC
jgi:hypothetical protein